MDFPESVPNNSADDSDHEKLIAIRDSKDPAGPVLFLAKPEWQALVRRIKSGDYDLE